MPTGKGRERVGRVEKVLVTIHSNATFSLPVCFHFPVPNFYWDPKDLGGADMAL